MLLSKLKPETRINYVSKKVQVKSALFSGTATLQAIRNNKQVVLKLLTPERFRPQATSKLTTLVIGVDHVFI